MKPFITILGVACLLACEPSRTTTQPQSNASPSLTAPNERSEPDQRATYDECAEWQRFIGRFCSTRDAGEQGCTPLMRAAANGQLNSVRELLNRGADVNKKDPSDIFSPLMLAARQGNQDVVKTLLAAGANPNASAGVTHVGRWSVLTMAMSRCNQNRIGLMDTLIAGGAQMNPPGQSPTTPLLHAIEQSDLEMVQAVLQRGADVNRTDDFGNTPLTAAVAMGDPSVEVVKLLLSAGADPNPPRLRVGGPGQTTSLLAYVEEYIEGSRKDGIRDEARQEIVRLLKQAGAKR